MEFLNLYDPDDLTITSWEYLAVCQGDVNLPSWEFLLKSTLTESAKTSLKVIRLIRHLRRGFCIISIDKWVWHVISMSHDWQVVLQKIYLFFLFLLYKWQNFTYCYYLLSLVMDNLRDNMKSMQGKQSG